MEEIKSLLGTELKQLEHEFRVELPREIKTAVAMGDLRENAEYHAALERQSYVRARIRQLRERLAALSAINLDQLPRDRAGLGSNLLLLDLDTDEEVRYELVVPELADPERERLSILEDGVVAEVTQPGDRASVSSMIDFHSTFHDAKESLIGRFEREYLAQIIARTGGNMSEAARQAGIDRTTLYRLMDKHELSKEAFVQ